MDKIGVSIIGCGGIAQVHLSALVQMLDQVRLVAAVDIVPEKARAAAEQYGIERWSASIDDALGSDTDVVFVCTPTNTHHQCAVPAFNAGKHVFCEKPLDRTLVHAQEILDAQKRSGKVGAVGFVRRYDQEWLLFRSLTQSGAIGRPVLWQDIAASSGPALHWFNLDEEGGGPFLDGAIHTIDFALYTFGPARSVYADGDTFGPENSAIDTGSACLRFQSGDELFVGWSWGLPKGCSGARVFQFLGPEGTITWPSGVVVPPPPGASESQKNMSAMCVNRAGVERLEAFPTDALTAAYERQIRQFLLAVRGEGEIKATIRHGYEALTVALGLLESARTHKLVTFDGAV